MMKTAQEPAGWHECGYGCIVYARRRGGRALET